MAPNRKVGSILLIDDQESFAHVVKGILGRIEEEMGEIHFASLRDPSSLSAYLNREGEYWNAPTPDLILVDANVPRRVGAASQVALHGGTVAQAIPVIPLIVDKCKTAKQEAADAYHALFKSLLSNWF